MKFHKLIIVESKLKHLVGFKPNEITLLREQNQLGLVDGKKVEELLKESLLQIKSAIDVGFVYSFTSGCMIGCWEGCVIRFNGDGVSKSFVINESDDGKVDLIPYTEINVTKYTHKEVSSILYHTSPFVKTLFKNSLEVSVV